MNPGVAAGGVDRYVCIHGHFYQPPRENPWLGVVEHQESAWPFHDWNERITDECYGPNAAAAHPRRRAAASRRIVNNFERISFNFGPTLMSWLERERAPTCTRALLAADRRQPGAVRRPRLGAGPGLQPHDPAARLGPRPARRRSAGASATSSAASAARPRACGCPRPPSTCPTLETWPATASRFTMLAPHQAAPGPALDATALAPASGGRRRRIDPRRPYLVAPAVGGARIALFFYDGPISQAVAFEQLLDDGRRLSRPPARRASTAPPTGAPARPHRHRRRDLRPPPPLRRDGAGRRPRAPRRPARRPPHQLRRVPRALPAPTHEAEIVEADGRGAAPTGSSAGAPTAAATRAPAPAGTSAGGRPLRAALDHLRDAVAAPYEERGGRPARRPVGGPRRLRRPRARPLRRGRSTASSPRHGRTRRSTARRPRPGPAAPRAPAPPHAHVHELRLVLRRPRRRRGHAGPALRRPGRAAWPRSWGWAAGSRRACATTCWPPRATRPNGRTARSSTTR